MFKKRLFLALAVAGLSVGTALSALNVNALFGAETTTTAFECAGGGSESFINIPSSSSAYATRTWTGDNNVGWSATDARTDQTLTGKAIALRTSVLKNTTTVPGGVGTLTFKYKRVFTGNSTLKVFVNGLQYGGDVIVSSETPNTFSFAVNVPGNVNIELRNTQNRIVVDDLSWTCYGEVVSGPEIQLANAAGTNVNCDELTLAYGSQSVDVYTDAVFSIKNTGTSVLNVTSLTLSNNNDFTVVSPVGAFNVPASGSAIVVVRFDAVSAGAKTSVLTISSNDENESRCTVSLTGTGLGVCATPDITAATIATDSITGTSANVEFGNVIADNFLAVLTVNDSLTSGPVDGFNYMVGDSIGGGVVAYKGENADFTLNGLTGETDYSLFVFALNNVDCSEGPKYAGAVDTEFTTLFAPCIGGSETFANMSANSSAYATRTWMGDNGVSWTATDARTDQTLTGRAIAMRTGELVNNNPVTGGIGTLSFNYKRVFNGESILKVFVNNVQYGGDITVTSDSPEVFSETIDVAGNVSIRIENSGNRTIIDDIQWNCYEIPNRPEIQLLDEALNAKACGDLTLDFGNVGTGSDKTATFVINNRGTVALEVSDLELSDTVNYSIVNPEEIPFVVGPLGSIDVVVKFNTATVGEKPATLTVMSNDTDEASCVVNLVANGQALCVAPSLDNATVLTPEVTATSATFEVNGVTADGYIAVVFANGTATAPENGETYIVGDMLGDGKVAYVGTDASFTITGLDSETVYTVYIYPYASADCANGPAYSAELETEIETPFAPCVGGSETFANMPANNSAYATRSWTGDNSVAWTTTDARTDQTLNGRAIVIRNGYLENTTAVNGGVGSITLTYARIYSNNSTLKVFVNGNQVGTDITVSSDVPATITIPANVSGAATIRIENSGNRTIIDDVQWNCYAGSTAKPAAAEVKNFDVKEVKVYPNPSNGQFQISLPEGEKEGNVEVYNSLGKAVLAKKVANEEMIDLTNAEKGIYMVNVKSGNVTETKKVIIK